MCVHCGVELTSGEKADRVFQPMSFYWEEGWPLQLRIKIIVGMLVLDFFLSILFLISNYKDMKDACSFTTIGGMSLMNVAIQVFLVGSFDALTVTRNAKGRANLVRQRRVAFYKIPQEKMAWKGSTGVGVVGSHNPGVVEWFMCGYLFMLGIVPGIVFFFAEVRPDRWEVFLCDVYGGTDNIVFHTKSRDQALDVAKMISEATRLMFKPTL